MPVAAHLAAIVVASLSTAPVEAGVLDVRTEGASHVLTFLLKLTCMFFDVPTHEKNSGREGGLNPGNNLHVSGLSHRVDTRDLEQTFAKIGRVRPYFRLQ